MSQHKCSDELITTHGTLTHLQNKAFRDGVEMIATWLEARGYVYTAFVIKDEFAETKPYDEPPCLCPHHEVNI